MAECLSTSTAARIGAALNSHEVLLERDGLAGRSEARFGVIMLDEGVDDENAPISLLERLAFHIDLDEVRLSDVAGSLHEVEEIAAARQCLADVQVDDDVVRAICEASLALGIVSPRALILTLRAARAAAALAGHREVSEPDVAMAAALVLGPRATVLPPAPSPEPEPSEQIETPAESSSGTPDNATQQEHQPTPENARPLDDVVLEAATAAIPANLLAQLQLPAASRTRASAAGRAGAIQASLRRGRPAGVRRGEPRSGARLNLVETLRAAAPWQILRRQEASETRTRRPSRRAASTCDWRIFASRG